MAGMPLHEAAFFWPGHRQGLFLILNGKELQVVVAAAAARARGRPLTPYTPRLYPQGSIARGGVGATYHCVGRCNCQPMHDHACWEGRWSAVAAQLAGGLIAERGARWGRRQLLPPDVS